MDTHEDSLLIDRSIIRLTPSITFMRNHFYTNSFVDLDYRCTRIDLRPFPKIETTPPFNSHCKSFLKNNRNFPSGIWINTREIFHTISHKKNSTDRSFSFSIQNKYTCVRSEHFEQLDHEYKPTTVRLPSRKNESTTLLLLLLLPPRTMASIVYLEIEAACNESSLEIVDDAPSKSGCAGIKRRHCLLPPSRPVRLERHLAEEVEDRLVRCLSTSRYSARFHGSRAETSDPSPRQWRGRGLFTTRWNGFLNLPPLRTRRRDSFDFVRFALTNPLHSYLMFKKVVDIRNENIFLGIYIYCKL